MKAEKFTKETILFHGVSERKFSLFKPGDIINVALRFKEGEKERTQHFEGIVLGIKGAGITKTFRVRKIVDGVAIERIFPYHSPIIKTISLVKECTGSVKTKGTLGKMRRAKLFYMRERKGKDSLRV